MASGIKQVKQSVPLTSNDNLFVHSIQFDSDTAKHGPLVISQHLDKGIRRNETLPMFFIFRLPFLLLQELAFTSDVPLAFRRNVLAHGSHIFASNHVSSNSSLNGDFEKMRGMIAANFSHKSFPSRAL